MARRVCPSCQAACGAADRFCAHCGQPLAAAPAVPPRPIRRLSPEERAQRRASRNVIMASLCIAVLIVTLAILIRMSQK